MKKRFALAALLMSLGAIGCATTTPPDKQYQADQPPPISKNTRPINGPSEVDAVKLPKAQTRISPEDIDEDNVRDNVRKLESELKTEKRALSQAK